MTGRILIDNGDLFAGSWEQLEDCFGITEDTLDRWCSDSGYYYSIQTDSELITEEYHRKQSELEAEYIQKTVDVRYAELCVVLEWFKENYPKRRLEWRSGMGTGFWKLDDTILDWDMTKHAPMLMWMNFTMVGLSENFNHYGISTEK